MLSPPDFVLTIAQEVLGQSSKSVGWGKKFGQNQPIVRSYYKGERGPVERQVFLFANR